MNRTIKNYEDLKAEQRRLLAELRSQEELIKIDLAGVQEGLKPVGNAFNVVKQMTTRDHTGTLLNFGLEFGIDLVLRKFLLARAGWFTKILIPFLVKNYSSHIISEDNRTSIVRRIRGLFNKIRPKPVTTPAVGGTSAAAPAAIAPNAPAEPLKTT